MDIRHSFLKGMNRDISKDKFPKDAYYYLLNGRILTDDDATMSDIINLKSNTAANINDNGIDRSTQNIIGYTTIQNDIVLFYAWFNAIGSDNYTNKSSIDVLEYQGNNLYSRRNVWVGVGLNFRIDKKIRAVARYESSDLKKIYWTDNNEALRYVNIGEDVSALKPSEFDFVGDFYDTPQIHLESYTSGSLKQGIIYYAYRFVKVNGYKTVFSQLSLPIPLARNIHYNNGIGNTSGDDIYDSTNAYNTGKGIALSVSINITDYYSYYDYIEIVSLWHSSKESIPDVTIVSRIELVNNVNKYNVIDEGTSNYGTLEYGQILGQQNSFTAKDLVAKDNRLFIGNITEDFFDIDSLLGSYWDSRAYRFDFNRSSELLDSDYNLEYTVNGVAPNYSAIAETADAINKYNKITDSSLDDLNSSSLPQMFKSDGVTRGGSGLNVEFNFYVGTYYISSISETNPSIGGSLENDYQLGLLRGFQRDEVYRFGIVFFDKKGRQSFVKWIADIRIPSIIHAGSVTSFDSSTSRIDAKPVFVQFDLINPPVISGEELDWQVVYVKREENDKSIVFSGLINPGVRLGSDTRPSMDTVNINDYGADADIVYNKYNIAMMSPDIVFKKTEYLNIDYVHVMGELTSYWPILKDRGSTSAIWIAGGPHFSGGQTNINIERFPELNAISLDKRITISDGAKVPPATNLEFTIPIGVDSYKSMAAKDLPARSAKHGTCMVYRLNAFLPEPVSTNYYYGYGRKIVYDSQYGGQIYENRLSNTYISASRRDATSVSTIICTRGDSFIRLFEYLRLIQEPEIWGKAQSLWEQFVCESSINILFRHDDVYSSKYYLDDSIPTYINEDVYVDTTTGMYFQELYKYNFAYSNVNQDRKFFSKPLNFVNYLKQPTKVKYSDVKINIEDHDSWLSFRSNNYNEAHNNYGEINRLVEFYDKIYCFQDTAISLISINPRVTQQSEDGVTITLGTGSVIDNFNYLNTNIGCQDNSDVVKSFSAMYWLDKNKKKIYTYNGKIQSITDLKGMHSYLKNNVLDDSYFIGTYDIHNSEVVMTLYDEILPNSNFQVVWYNPTNMWDLQGDVTSLDYNFIIGNVYKFGNGWFTLYSITDYRLRVYYSHGTDFIANEFIDMHIFMSERDTFTVAFNEKIQAFTSFYSFIPDLYISHNRDFFTSTNSRDLWQHNIGDTFNEFYNNTYPLQLKLISNFGTQAQGEYTNIKYFMAIKDQNNDYLRNETLTNIHCKNEYQATTDIILYPMHLPNDSDRTKYILDTSSIRIGIDWHTGLNTPYEGLAVYQNELYRCINQLGHIGPPIIGTDWEIAELANIRKTIERWITQLPRYEDRTDIYDTVYLTSDRLRSNWMETTLEYRSVLPTVNIEEREIKLSDIILSSTPMRF